MRLVEFLIYLLEAHAQTLQRLAALLSEEILIEILESQDERVEGPGHTPHAMKLDPAWFESDCRSPASSGTSGKYGTYGNAYGELEGAVQEMKIPAVLQFYLWAYPPYRDLIESSFDLNCKIRGPGSNAGSEMVDCVLAQAESWAKNLPLPNPLAIQAQRAAHVPWLRFRAEVLKRIGRRPMGPVY